MSKNRVLAGYVVAAIVLSMCACARKTIVLQNRFTKGEELRYLLTTSGEGMMSIGGLPGQKSGTSTPVKLQVELAYTMRVKDTDDKGNADIEYSFQRFSSATQSGTLKIETEADEKGARVIHGGTVIKEAPGLDGLRALFKNPTMARMDAQGNVLSTTPPKDVGELLPHTNIYTLLKQTYITLPQSPIPIGHSWNEKRDVTLGGGMEDRLPATKSLKLDTSYTLSGFVRKNGRSCADITLRGEVAAKELELNPPQGAAVPMSVMLDHLRQSVKGNVYFDPQKGMLIGLLVDTTQQTAMTMKVAKGGVEPFTSSTQMKMHTELKLVE